MQNLKFQYLALKLHNVPANSKYVRMQRNLHSGILYSFVDGIEVLEEEVRINDVAKNTFCEIRANGNEVSLSINAIVGENGSGKSTLIDYIVRILNNLSATIFGEEYRTPGAEHLHFIYGVYASLYVLIEDTVLEIICMETSVRVTLYIWNEAANAYRKREDIHYVDVPKQNTVFANPKVESIDMLRSFCYSIVTNFSLYAFNSNCYQDEATDYVKEDNIRKAGKNANHNVQTLYDVRKEYGKGRVNECRNWLQGLFYKNDGYQVPVVLAPMRDSGRMDMQKEYRLAKERMMSLLFMKDNRGEHFFKRINGKLLVDGININKDNFFEYNVQEEDTRKKYLPKLSLAAYRDIAGYIVISVKNLCGINNDVQKDHHDLVWRYIVKKILKIIFLYPRYVTARAVLNNYNNDNIGRDLERTISGIVERVLHDHSHVTRKLYRSIYYLKFDHISKKKSLHIESFAKEIEALVAGGEEYPYLPFCSDELLPPPVFHVNFRLFSVNDVQMEQPIMFSSLSSGEKQITYTLSTLFYHLANLDSVGNVQNDVIEDANQEVIQYKYVMAIFDEIELYFHPEMQRTFISYMIDGLEQMRLQNIKGLQILMATHSPFILSDIPQSKVLFMDKYGVPAKVDGMCTFGANIHTMLKSSFFLQNGAMGAFAQKVINRTFSVLNFYNIMHQIMLLQDNPDADVRETKEAYLWASNRRLINALNNDQQNALQNKDFAEYLAEEEKEMENVQAIIDTIHEPIIKQAMVEQLNVWKDYVAVAN